MSVLQRPEADLSTPERAGAVLRRLGLDWAAEVGILRPIPPVAPLSARDATEWWVGEAAVVSLVGGELVRLPETRWACDCTPVVPARCRHVATALLLHAWNREETRALFEQPAWSLALEPLLRPVEAEPPPPGYLRYRLLPTRAADGLPVAREWVRLSRRDGRALRPAGVPESLAELEASVGGLTHTDRAFHRAWEARHVLGRLTPRGVSGGQVGRLREELAAAAMARVLELDVLHYLDRLVRVDPRPLDPVLEVCDADDELVLAWADAVVEVYPVGPGYVLTGTDVLRPLAVGVAVDALLAPLPPVPVSDAPRFLEEFVREAGVTLDLQSAHLPPTMTPDAVEGHVYLTEAEDALHVELRYGYRLGTDTVTVDAGARGQVLAINGRLVARERGLEAAVYGRLRATLGRSAPAVLRGEAALDFLLEGLAALGPGWRAFGDVELAHHRVAGRLQASVRVPSGVDWFDLEVAFTVGEEQVSTAEVLQSWQAGRRYLRLEDGGVARLPDAWLERFGKASRQLEDLRAVGEGRLPAYAAPVVAELLAEDAGAGSWRALLDSLIDFTGVPQRTVPETLCATLRDYQVQGFRWLCFLREQGLGGCLADDMGLGKTVQALTALLDTHEGDPDGPPSLVVSPTSVVHNWLAESARFTPTLKVYVHHGPERGGLADFAAADLVVTSYALMRLDAEQFVQQPWRMVILDEAQHIKNPHSKVARTARSLDARHRLALTGTPLENHLGELWSIFEFLMPGFFGSRAAFQRDFAVPVQRDRDMVAAAALRRRLRPFILRRLKGEVAAELPPRQEQTLYCELGEEQRALYERVKSTYRASVLTRVEEVGLRRATLSVLEALMRLRQACCDPALLPFVEADTVVEAAKLDLLEETLEEIIAAGHRSLVFSQWPSLLRRVVPRLEARGWTFLFLDGHTRNRGDLVGRWNDPAGPPVFLISLKAGGSGLNLTGADHVIHLDPWWNPAAEDQATDRAHRIGQTRPVMAYKLVARDTVEEKILELQAHKRALFAAAVDQERLVVETLTREDLEAVFAPVGEVDQRAAADPVSTPLMEARPPSEDPLALLALLRPGVLLTNAHVREATGWGSRRSRQWLREQVESGRLEQRGRKRGTHYVVAER